jgi:hypothetical protein
LDELYAIIKNMPGYVLGHKVKGIEALRDKAVRLNCGIVTVLLTQNVGEVKGVYKLNGFINLIATLVFSLFAFGGIIALVEGFLHGDDRDVTTGVISIAIAIGVNFIRNLLLRRGRNVISAIEEYLPKLTVDVNSQQELDMKIDKAKEAFK